MVTKETRVAEVVIDKRAQWIKDNIDVVYGSPIQNLKTYERQGQRRDFRGEKLYFVQAQPKARVRI